jgi:hypothetical protein
MSNGNPSAVATTSELQPNASGTSGSGLLVQSGILKGAISTYKIEPLKEDNWVAWSIRMIGILKLQKVYRLVDGTENKPDGGDPTACAVWEEKDLVAQVLIKNNLSDEQMVHCDPDTITTAAQLWQGLRSVHETRGHSAIAAAKRTFYAMRAADDANIPKHIAEMRRQCNKLCQMGCKLSDEEYKSVLVISLPSSWDYFVTSYQGTHTSPETGRQGITSQELTSILIDEYHRRTSQTTKTSATSAASQSSQSYYAKSASQSKKRKAGDDSSSQISKGKKKKCAICGKVNHLTDDCRFKGKPKCGNCGYFGHKTDDCWGDKPPKKSGGKGKGKEQAKIAEADEDAEMSYVAEANVTDVSMNDDTVSFYCWYADSATTSHLTNTRSAFIDYKSIEPLPIYGVGKSSIWAYGRGTVEAMSFIKGKPKVFHLKETLFTPEITDNLMSIGRIDEAGGKVIFGGKRVVIYDTKHNEIVDGNLSSNRLYPLNMYRQIAIAENCNITTMARKDTWNDWHRKFGHVSISGLQKLVAKDLVDGLDIDKDSMIEDCIACKEAKQTHAQGGTGMGIPDRGSIFFFSQVSTD